MGCHQSLPSELNDHQHQSTANFDSPLNIMDDPPHNHSEDITVSPVISPDTTTRTLSNGTKYKLSFHERIDLCYLSDYSMNQLYHSDYNTCMNIFKSYDKSKSQKLDKRAIKKLSLHICIRLMYEYYIQQKQLQTDIPDDKLRLICQNESKYIVIRNVMNNT